MSGITSQNPYPEPPPCGSDVNTINIENVDHMTIRADQVIVSKPKKRLCRRRRRRPEPEEADEDDGADGDACRDGDGGDDEDEEGRPSRSQSRSGRPRRRRGRGRERRVFTVMRVRKVRDSYGGEDTPVESSGDDEVVDYSGDDDDEGGAVAAAMMDAALSTGGFPWRAPPPQGPCCRPGSGASSQHRGFGRFDRRESKEVQTIYPTAGASRSILRMSTRRSGAVRPPYPPLQADWTQTSNHAFQYYGGPPPRPPPQSSLTQSYRQEWPRPPTYANEWSQTSQHRLPPPSPLNEARYTQTSNYALQQQMGGPPPNQLPPQVCCTGRPCINPVICPSTGTNTFSSQLPPSQPVYVGSQSQVRDQHGRWGQAPYSQPPLQLMDWTQTQNYANDWTQTSNYRLNQFGGAPPISGPSQQMCCSGLPCRYPTICPGNAVAPSTYPPFYQAPGESQQYQQQPFSPRPQMEQTDWTQTSLSNVASQRMQSSNYGLPPGGHQSHQVTVGDRRSEIPFSFQGPCQAQNRCCACDLTRGPPDRGPATPSAVELPQASFSFESSEEPRVRVQRSSTICRRSRRTACEDKGVSDGDGEDGHEVHRGESVNP